MTIAPRPGMLRFDGDVAVFYMTICRKCDMAIPHPDETVQTRWGHEHFQGTGHHVTLAVDVRPDTRQTENRRRQLVDRLREKYSHPATRPAAGCGGCRQMILAGDPMMQWDRKLWHAGCLDDGSYLRMATVADIAPGVLADVEPVTMKTWMPGDAWDRANPSYRFTGSGPQTVIAPSDPVARHANFVSALGVDLRKAMADATGYEVAMIATNVDKKPNARERRRQRREGKQWQRKN